MSDARREVFDRLRQILLSFGASLAVKTDEPSHLYIDTHHVLGNGKPLFFGAVKATKSYVSFHLMPVYVNPSLLDGVSPELTKRMQGKSCFSFRTVDDALFDELAGLTRRGFEDYRKRGYLGVTEAENPT